MNLSIHVNLFLCRFLVHDPNQRLGAEGLSEVVFTSSELFFSLQIDNVSAL